MAETHPKFDVAIVTPEGDAFRGEAEMLVVPGAAGDIGVLARHAPLVATLRAGSTRVYLDREADNVVELATGPGFFKVELDRAIALDDGYAKALQNRAAIHTALGDRSRALADYRRLDELGHDVSDAIARLVAP